MRPRTSRLIGSLALGLLVGCSLAAAQQAGKVYRIGLLISASNVIAPFTDAFRQGLQELGYVEGNNFTLETRGAEEKLDQGAAELVNLKVDVIVTVGSPALRAAAKATSTIPIVMRTGLDPVSAGLVASLAHPGGNLTGRIARSVGLSAKRLELITQTIPRAKRIAVLTRSRRISAREGRLYKELDGAARALGMKLQILKARNPSEIDNAFLVMAKGRADALLVIPTATYVEHRKRIVKHTLENRLPSFYSHRQHVASGGLMSYGVDYIDEYRRTAIYVDKILRGANPGELPIEQPTKFQLVINLKTARQLGITIPRDVLYRATEVIK